ncbi:MAG: energy transducer TonB [Luteibacter sp.]
MLALRTSTSLSALGLVLGIAGTSWLTALTYERAPATRPLAEIVMPSHLPRLSANRATPSAPVDTERHVRPRAVVDLAAVPRPTPKAAVARPEPLVPVYMPSPRYPMAALRAQREGQVVLSVTVTQDGDVSDVSVGRSSGDQNLDRAAEDAVRGWRFASTDNRPPRYTADLPIRFELTRPAF